MIFFARLQFQEKDMKAGILYHSQNPNAEDIHSASTNKRSVCLKTRVGPLHLTKIHDVRGEGDLISFTCVCWYSTSSYRRHNCTVTGYNAKTRASGHIEIELPEEEERRAQLNYPDFW